MKDSCYSGDLGFWWYSKCFLLKANTFLKAGSSKKGEELFRMLKHEALVKTTEHLRTKVYYKQIQLCNLQASGWETFQARGYHGPLFPKLREHLILPTLFLNTITAQMTKSTLSYSFLHFPFNMWIQIIDNSTDVTPGRKRRAVSLDTGQYLTMWMKQV